MDARKMLILIALCVGGVLAMAFVNMDGGRIAGKWGGECHGTTTMLRAKGGRVDLKHGMSHWEAPFESGDINTAQIDGRKISFSVDYGTRVLQLDLPGQEPCFLQRL